MGKETFGPCLEALPVIPALRGQGQEDGHKFKVRLVQILHKTSSTPAKVAEQNPVIKKTFEWVKNTRLRTLKQKVLDTSKPKSCPWDQGLTQSPNLPVPTACHKVRQESLAGIYIHLQHQTKTNLCLTPAQALPEDHDLENSIY